MTRFMSASGAWSMGCLSFDSAQLVITLMLFLSLGFWLHDEPVVRDKKSASCVRFIHLFAFGMSNRCFNDHSVGNL